MLYVGSGCGPHETRHIVDELLAATLLLSPILITSLGPKDPYLTHETTDTEQNSSKTPARSGGARI